MEFFGKVTAEKFHNPKKQSDRAFYKLQYVSHIRRSTLKKPDHPQNWDDRNPTEGLSVRNEGGYAYVGAG